MFLKISKLLRNGRGHGYTVASTYAHPRGRQTNVSSGSMIAWNFLK